MPKLKTEKQKLYYNKVLKLHEEKGYSAQLISKLVPVAKQTVYNWLRIAQEEKDRETEAMAKKTAPKKTPTEETKQAESSPAYPKEAIAELREHLLQLAPNSKLSP